MQIVNEGSFWWEGGQGEQASLMGVLDGRLVHGQGMQVGLTAGGRGQCKRWLVQRDGALERCVETQRECDTKAKLQGATT